MKGITLLFAALFILIGSGTTIQAQNDISIFEKKEGQTNIVYARNIGKVDYLVTLKITSEGMKVTPGASVEAVVPAGKMKEMARITPIPGQAWSYGYEVSYMEYTGQPLPEPAKKTDEEPSTSGGGHLQTLASSGETVTSDIAEDELVLYTKPGCGRCATARKTLTTKGVAFVELDVNSGSPEVQLMWRKLREGGFQGNSVTMPVIRSNGEYHYNISNLTEFLARL